MLRIDAITVSLFIGLCFACDDSQPVGGVPDAPLLNPDGDPGLQLDAPESNTPKEYEKASNVLVDAHFLGGRSFRNTRGEISKQLGALVSTRTLPSGRGDELQFARGTIRVVEDRIAMIRIPLTEPMRRSQALESTGFPIMVDTWTTTHREYRLNHEWGFRFMRLKRLGPDSEFVTEVEAWKWRPREHSLRR